MACFVDHPEGAISEWGDWVDFDRRVRLQLHALATFLRCIDLPSEAMPNWSLTSLQLKLLKVGARVVHHAHVIFDAI